MSLIGEIRSRSNNIGIGKREIEEVKEFRYLKKKYCGNEDVVKVLNKAITNYSL